MASSITLISKGAMLLCSLTLTLTTVLADEAPVSGKAAYTKCAACHLPTGQGVPGAFPPIADRIEKFAAVPAGRAYLVTVVKAGLIGSITVSGTPYYGAMPGLASALDDASVSSVLNYIARELGSEVDEQFEPFTPEEVAGYKSQYSVANGNSVHKMRSELLHAVPELQ